MNQHQIGFESLSQLTLEGAVRTYTSAGVPHSCASNAGPNLEENNSNSNGDFNDNFNVSDAYHGCNNFADGGNDKSNDNGNQNGKGGSGARRLRTGRAQALPTAAEKEGLQEDAEEEEESTAVGLAGTATFGPAPNPNRTREYGPSNREEQEGGERERGEEGFFCGVCGERVKSLSEEKHNTSTLHIFNQQHRPADRKVRRTLLGMFQADWSVGRSAVFHQWLIGQSTYPVPPISAGNEAGLPSIFLLLVRPRKSSQTGPRNYAYLCLQEPIFLFDSVPGM